MRIFDVLTANRGRLTEALGFDVLRAVFTLTGYPRTTVCRWVKERNDSGMVKVPQLEHGRRIAFDSEHVQFIQDKLEEYARAGTRSGARKITLDVNNKFQTDFHLTTIRNAIRGLGFRWGRGNRINIAALQENHVLYRNKYCRLKTLNCTPGPGVQLTLPEIFLDESYCEEGHSGGMVWYSKSVPFMVRGRGQKFVIVGAGIIRSVKGKLVGEWVPGSLVFWNPALKKPRKYGEVSLPAFDVDYHGNVNAANFEAWFRAMCKAAFECYGPCRIHLDGCSAHKREKNKGPTSSSRKNEIGDALDALEVDHDMSMLKDTLYKLYLEHKHPKEFFVHDIAKEFGHELHFTPPYHPILNPIEKVWAVGKNYVAETQISSMAELEQALTTAFTEKVTSKTWVGAWWTSRLADLKYLEKFENDDMPVAEDGDGEDDDDDADDDCDE